MKSIRGFALVALLAAGMCAGRAHAADAQGKFTLPHDIRWGLATLPAGDYNFIVRGGETTGVLRLYRGTRGVALLQSHGYDRAAPGSPALLVVEEQGVRSVRELYLPGAGVVYYYAPHRAKHVSPWVTVRSL